MAQVTLFQRFYITCPSSKEQFKYLDKLLLFLFRTWQVFLTDVEFRRTAHDLLRHGVLLILIQIDFRDNYGIDRISSCVVGDGQRDWTAAARGEIRKRKHRAAAKDFILSPRLLRLHENPITKDSLRQYSHLCSAELLRNRDWRGRIYDLTPQVRLGRCGV